MKIRSGIKNSKRLEDRWQLSKGRGREKEGGRTETVLCPDNHELITKQIKNNKKERRIEDSNADNPTGPHNTHTPGGGKKNRQSNLDRRDT